MTDTNRQYDLALRSCREIFIQKAADYGTSWRVLRIISVVDQIYIKARRIRNIQELGKQMVEDDISGEFRGIVNYGIIGLIQLEKGGDQLEDLQIPALQQLFDAKSGMAKSMMLEKNHDYGEAWRDMGQESYVDLILMKLVRVKQILANEGKTLVSEGIDANFLDIINYALFGLIQVAAGRHPG
jgi:hypothetical protein